MTEPLQIETPRPAECRRIKTGHDGVQVEAWMPHNWRWFWENGNWTDRVYCSACLKQEVRGNYDG